MSDGATRERIHRAVTDDPGIHFSGIVRALDLAPGQVQHHVRRLQNQGRVVKERHHGRAHYFPPGFDPDERAALAVLRRETPRDVVLVLLDEGASSPAEVAEAVDVARSTLEWHLDHLVEAGVVEKTRDDRGRVTLEVPEKTEVVRLLDAADVTLPASMVDRFTRLVDRLLGE